MELQRISILLLVANGHHNCIKYTITVRLTFLAYSVRMRPNFQGLPWFEFGGLGEDELLIRFLPN
jgi:hypothetical protein